jgi:hypothetical protein
MKMKNRTYSARKAQAAVELAIFGSIVLLAFSIMLMYGQRLDSQQQVKMEAFRRALQKAYYHNSSVSYTLKKEGRSFNLFGGFGQGQSATVSSTASVLWQKGLPGEQPTGGAKMKQETYSYYVINDNEIKLDTYPKLQKTLTGGNATVYVPAGVYNEEAVRTELYNTTVRKEESPAGGIINTRVADLGDTIRTTLHVRVDTSYDSNVTDHVAPLPRYVEEGQSYTFEGDQKTVASVPSVSLGAYYRNDTNRVEYSNATVGTTIHKERTWQTGN